LTLPVAVAKGEVRSLVLAVIGEKGAGKSTFLGALIQQLVEGRLAERAGITPVWPQDSFDVELRELVSSRALYKKRYGDALFGDNRRTLEGTKSIKTNHTLRTPLIYELRFDHRPRWQRPLPPWAWANQRVTDLIVYDTAGEDLETPAIVEHYYRYLPWVDGVIFLIDPMRLASVRQLLQPAAPRGLAEGPSRASNIFANFLKQYSLTGPPVYRDISTPVAVVVSKSDELVDVVGHSSPLLSPSDHTGGLDLKDAKRTSEDVRGFLKIWGESNLVGALKRFPRAGFFAVSSLGHRPPEDGRIDPGSYSPKRVVDPLFWILYQLGFLPAVSPYRPPSRHGGGA
jgi:GTPase SAR1 family protein